jgi:hypothetical protein
MPFIRQVPSTAFMVPYSCCSTKKGKLEVTTVSYCIVRPGKTRRVNCIFKGKRRFTEEDSRCRH